MFIFICVWQNSNVIEKETPHTYSMPSLKVIAQETPGVSWLIM